MTALATVRPPVPAVSGVVAERERALADGTPTPRATWHDAASAIIGLWQAPVTAVR